MLIPLRNCCHNIPQRWVLGLMCFLGVCAAFAMRACLSIAITEMVVKPESSENSKVGGGDDSSCPAMDFGGYGSISVNRNRNVTIPDRGELYDWDEYTQGIILGSFYWGYVITHLPGGLVADKYGGKHTLGIGILSTAIFTLLTPAAVKWGDSTALVALRVAMGFGEGTTFPAINVLLAQWTPPEERSRTASFVYAGSMIGTIFATTVSGVILKYWSWELVFYAIGVISALWYVLWLMWCYNSPREHPYITSEELDYLRDRMAEHTLANPPPTPWSHILRSKPLWSVIIALVGFNWSVLALITDLPKYMSGVLKFPVELNGYLSSFIYLCMFLGNLVASTIADLAIGRDARSATMVRKVGSVLSLTCASSVILAASYAGCNRVLVVAVMTVAFAMLGAGYSSVMINALDLSPNYAGVLMAFTNGFSALTGIFSPYVIGVLTTTQSLVEWRMVFKIMLGVSITTNCVFLAFGSGDTQYWNDPAKNIEQIKEKPEKSQVV